MATHSSILAWEIPWTEEPGGLQSMGLQRVGQDWAAEHARTCIASSYQHAQPAWCICDSRWAWWSGSSLSLKACSLHQNSVPFSKGSGWRRGFTQPWKETQGLDHHDPQRCCWKLKVLVAQSCPALCDPMDSSLTGSSVCGILQPRTLEWAAIPFSRGSSRPRDWIQASCIAGRFFTGWATSFPSHFPTKMRLTPLVPYLGGRLAPRWVVAPSHLSSK